MSYNNNTAHNCILLVEIVRWPVQYLGKLWFWVLATFLTSYYV